MAGKCEKCGEQVKVSTAHHEAHCSAESAKEKTETVSETTDETAGGPVAYYAQLVNAFTVAVATQAGHQMVDVEVSLLGPWRSLMSKDFRAAFWDRKERGPYECIVMVAREILNARQLYPEIEEFLGASETTLAAANAFPDEDHRPAAVVEFLDADSGKLVNPDEPTQRDTEPPQPPYPAQE